MHTSGEPVREPARNCKTLLNFAVDTYKESALIKPMPKQSKPKSGLTSADLDAIRQLIHLATEDLRLELRERTENLPSKNEFFNRMDELVALLRAVREEQRATSLRLSRAEDRLRDLESIHPSGGHS